MLPKPHTRRASLILSLVYAYDELVQGTARKRPRTRENLIKIAKQFCGSYRPKPTAQEFDEILDGKMADLLTAPIEQGQDSLLMKAPVDTTRSSLA